MHAAVRRLRRFSRLAVDAAFCTGGNVVPFGKENVWHIDPSRLPPTARVISGGVGKDISLEKELIQYHGARVLLVDPSPTGRATMGQPQNTLGNIEFLPVGLAGADGARVFSPPADPEEGSFRLAAGGASDVPFACRSVSSLARERGWAKVDLLKIDIEGFEYEVLDDVLTSELEVSQICVEFHHFMPGIPIWRTIQALQNLRRRGYSVLHKSGTDWTFGLVQ